MCIYYGDSPELTYENREHVFPAGLGGKQRLAIGVVSDQANTRFSPIEMKLMRQSPVGLFRMLFGPGDRGSLSPDKASKSLVSVGREDDGTPVLCYYSAGKTYDIPQVLFYKDTSRVSFPTMQENDVYIKQFLDVLQKFDNDKKYVHLNSSFLSPGNILLGYYERKYYVASSGERPTAGEIKDIIQSLSQYTSIKKADSTEHRVEQELIIYEDPQLTRVYAKTAMNVLAHLKGANFAANPAFDHFRKWIITGESNEEYSFWPDTITKKGIADGFSIIIPQDSHWCIFLKIKSKLVAEVCFYNRFCRYFTFGEIPNEECTFPFGFFCDWKTEQEYTLDECIYRFMGETNVGD